MTDRKNSLIALIGSYVPRRCGIATFSYNLASALAQRVDRKARVTVLRPQLHGAILEIDQ